MKSYAVFGGSSGIGKALVQLLLQSNNKVFASHRSTPTEETENCTTFHWDSEKNNIPKDLFPEALSGLVYCPGNIVLKPFHRIKREEFLADYESQVLGAIEVIQTLLPNLKQTPSSIVLFSTIAVQQGFTHHSLISSSKGALEGLTRALAAEFSPNIRVNAIAPSLTDTPLSNSLLNSEKKREWHSNKNPSKKIATANEVARVAKWLLNEESSYVNGQVLSVDGGLSRIRM